MSKKIAVLYHDNCPDGFGSAWSFWKKYGNRAEYIPVKHGSKPPPLFDKDEVYIVDFSYPRDILIGLKKEILNLKVIDHHISAQKDLGDLDFCIFDMGHSGAYLSWSYLFGEDNVPNLIRYIEDRDLWKWELPFSEEILSAVDAFEKTFEIWDQLDEWLDVYDSNSFNRLKFMGSGILKYKNNLISNIVKNSFDGEIYGHKVKMVNAPFFQSEVASMLAKDMPFGAAYYFNGSSYFFSSKFRRNLCKYCIY